jgi:hypothetical protein
MATEEKEQLRKPVYIQEIALDPYLTDSIEPESS